MAISKVRGRVPAPGREPFRGASNPADASRPAVLHPSWEAVRNLLWAMPFPRGMAYRIADMDSLFRDHILDHYRNPRCHGTLERPDARV